MSLHIQQVTKTFSKTQALKEINLDIRDSEFVAILGPSGCGKTTLLRIVGGFIELQAVLYALTIKSILDRDTWFL